MKCTMNKSFLILKDNFNTLKKSIKLIFILQKSSIFFHFFFIVIKLALQFMGLYLINTIFLKIQYFKGMNYSFKLIKLILFYLLCMFISELVSDFFSKYYIQFIDIPKFDCKIKESVQKICVNANALKFENYEINHFIFQCSFSGTNIYRIVEVFFNQIEVILSFMLLFIVCAKINFTYMIIIFFLFIPIFLSNVLKTNYYRKSRPILNRIESKENELYNVCSNPEYTKENKVMNLNRFIISKIQELTYKYNELLKIDNNKYFKIDLITETAKIFFNCLALLLALFQFSQRKNIGEIVILIQGYRILNSGMIQFFELNSHMNMFSNLVKPYFNIISILKNHDKKPENAIFNESIELSNISFHYPNSNENSIINLSLKIKKGEKVAIVGPNGSGKTTLSKIILQLLEPNDGQIKIDGKIIEKNELNFLNNKWKSAMFQDFCNYPLTIRQNIQISDNENDNTDCINIILEEIGLNLDQNEQLGINLGNRDLSGGQWQRLALGRLIYSDKNFIVLDEPTSEIDPVFENKIFELVEKYFHDKTIVIITHSLKSVRDADKIVLMNNGKIEDIDKHEELLKKSSLYKKIWMAKISTFEIIK